MNELILTLMADPALQNLDYLRQLIAEARADSQYMDMEKLRMIQGTGMGTAAAQTEDV